ncbi:MAG: GNAT family N-acetyltransferase [Armatimonadetes bacterium]|nr:GNAT family N-acetyltransferase [Armatimonadota bacterium]NIM24193.1 GNAT family N-acetyltransferase [Armatimonadota bacterium]NIM68058.1 GNAT family N-acetyltransferase [Armatimonadota bacterium]NIM76092.1 GNAT family N-acetyltransferase [Armatimonadota bacterium]NIN05763.1 GNAT family N-acetyltransferase [Armatimonadota bacterium]
MRATKGDEVTASSIMQEAMDWRAQLGDPMWEPEEFAPAALAGRIEAGAELYFAKVKGEPVGTMIFQWEDELFWPDVPSGESAFIHRLAVRRAVARSGVSKALIEWAKDTAKRAGRKYLRLDCDPKRPRLCAFYESAGFVFHSLREIGEYTVARYEIRLDASADG